MLDPRVLDSLPDEIASLYSDVATDIIADMARRIATYDYYIPSAEHQRQMLREMGATQEMIIKRLSKMTGRSEKELQRLMQDACNDALETDKEYYKRHGKEVPTEMSVTMRSILQAGYRSTNKMFVNLTHTTATEGSTQIVQALDKAWLQVKTGGFDVNTAIRNAIKGIARKGIYSVGYASGRKETLEVAVRRAVLTGINQTAAEMQLQLASEVDSDLVETTAHAGARPSHTVWQGKIFSLSGKSGKYPDFRTSTGYGTGAGLCGWNCRHSFFPHFEGEQRAYTSEELADYNKKTIVYNGESYTEYEATQIQRRNERQIRRWKREKAALEAAGEDTTEAETKLQIWRAEQLHFIKETGLKRQRDREMIAQDM